MMDWDPQLKNTLAGEYVAGAMDGDARRTFEDRMAWDDELREAVNTWERRFDVFAEALPEVRPPKRVWKAIHRRVAPEPDTGGLWASLAFWRSAAAFATVAALALGLSGLLLKPAGNLPQAVYVAVFTDDQAKPMFVVSQAGESGQMRVRSLTHPAADKSYELWLLPDKQRSQPVSLGLLPEGGADQLRIAGNLRAAIRESTGLAVSLEPYGGSPKPVPTGPVKGVATMVAL